MIITKELSQYVMSVMESDSADFSSGAAVEWRGSEIMGCTRSYFMLSVFKVALTSSMYCCVSAVNTHTHSHTHKHVTNDPG